MNEEIKSGEEIIEKIEGQSDNTEKKQTDKPWLFKPGQSGNPNGRPKGSISITSKVKEMLAEIPPGQKSSFLDILVKKIIKKAVLNEDDRMINRVWNYVDGLPKQVMGFDLDEMVNEVKIEIKQSKKNDSQHPINNGVPKELEGVSGEDTSDSDK